MSENKSNRTTRAPPGVQAPSVIAVISGSFSFLCLFFFFATQLGTNPIVKGDCHEYTKMLRAQVQSSVFRMMTQSYFYRTRQIICHLSDCLTNWPQSHRASGVRDAVFLLVFRFELLTCLSDLGNQKECVLCSEWNKIWKVVFISAQSKHPKGEGGGARIHNPNNS